MLNKDRDHLRELAKKQMELAHSPKMSELRKAWENHGAFSPASRPMILIEIGTFADDFLPQLMQCEGDSARILEWELLAATVNHTHFDDDSIVKDYIPVVPERRFIPFGIEVKTNHAKDGKGDVSLGHHFISAIGDLERDFHKLGKSVFEIKMDSLQNAINFRNEVYGDILPAKRAGFSMYCGPTQDIVHIMSMEDMFVAMCDYPDLFNKMMTMLVDDYLEYFDLHETESVLLPSYDECHLAQGSYCFTDELSKQGTALKTTELWGYLDSQETTGVSPKMFSELVAPHYSRIAARYGLLSYGCCEAVDPIWDCFLSGLDNLRKLSVSPWANEEYIGQILRGKKIVYMRKPSPNYLGVGADLDEQAVTAHIDETIKFAKGCHLEIIQRDVYKINKSTEKVKRYVELIRKCSEKHMI